MARLRLAWRGRLGSRLARWRDCSNRSSANGICYGSSQKGSRSISCSDLLRKLKYVWSPSSSALISCKTLAEMRCVVSRNRFGALALSEIKTRKNNDCSPVQSTVKLYLMRTTSGARARSALLTAFLISDWSTSPGCAIGTMPLSLAWAWVGKANSGGRFDFRLCLPRLLPPVPCEIRKLHWGAAGGYGLFAQWAGALQAAAS